MFERDVSDFYFDVPYTRRSLFRGIYVESWWDVLTDWVHHPLAASQPNFRHCKKAASTAHHLRKKTFLLPAFACAGFHTSISFICTVWRLSSVTTTKEIKNQGWLLIYIEKAKVHFLHMCFSLSKLSRITFRFLSVCRYVDVVVVT